MNLQSIKPRTSISLFIDRNLLMHKQKRHTASEYLGLVTSDAFVSRFPVDGNNTHTIFLGNIKKYFVEVEDGRFKLKNTQ